MNENAQFEDLPPYWQEQIKKYRREGRNGRLERNRLREQVAELTAALADRVLDGGK
jgi:hypothetical protein